jgi:putative redox protein
MAPEYGGAGRSFSATDLLAAALGVCVATNIDVVAVRHGISLEAIEIRVQKTLAREPKSITGLRVTIALSTSVPGDVRLRLERAAEHCAVHRSLHPRVCVFIEICECGQGGQACTPLK